MPSWPAFVQHQSHDTWLQDPARHGANGRPTPKGRVGFIVALNVDGTYGYRQAIRTEHATAVSGATGCQDIKMAFRQLHEPSSPVERPLHWRRSAPWTEECVLYCVRKATPQQSLRQ